MLLLQVFVLEQCSKKSEAPESLPKVEQKPAATATGVLKFKTLDWFPHDTSSFTEGLLIHEGKIYESTGATSQLPFTRSLFGVLNRANGHIEVKAELDRKIYFGEGICFLNGKVYQLTYQSKVGFIYDAKSFKKLGKFDLPSAEGWGMTTDGSSLIMSDGTNLLKYLDPKTLKVTKTLSVSQNGYPLQYLNELEYVDGYIYANVWTTNRIVKIRVSDATVVGDLDLSSLAEQVQYEHHSSAEMNGIAYDAAKNTFLVTGKLWPRVFEIQITE